MHACRSTLEDPTDPSDGIRLCDALWWFWSNRGYWREGRDWILKALERNPLTPETPAAVRRSWVRARSALGMFHWLLNEFDAADEASREALEQLRELGDRAALAQGLVLRTVVAWRRLGPEQSEAFGQESLRLYREVGHNWGTALSLQLLANGAHTRGRIDEAGALAGESHSLFVLTGDRWGQAMSLHTLGQVATARGQYPRARAHFTEALEYYQALGNRWACGFSFYGLGVVAWSEGEREKADSLLAEAERTSRELDERMGLAYALLLRGQLARQMGRAPDTHREALTHFRDLGDLELVALAVEACAGLALDAGQYEEAAALFGATASAREGSYRRMPPVVQESFRRDQEALRKKLDEAAFHAAWQRGETMSLGAAILLAEASVLPASFPSPSPP